MVVGAIRASVEEDNPFVETNKAGIIHTKEVGTATVVSGFVVVSDCLDAKDDVPMGCLNGFEIDFELS